MTGRPWPRRSARTASTSSSTTCGLAYVAYHDHREQLQVGIDAVRQAADAAGAIRAWAHVQTWHNPRIAAVARALDATRHEDQDAAAAWDDRSADRMRDATAIVKRLRAEGRLHPSWADDEAAVLLRELTSFRVWDDLVNDAKIPSERYIELIAAAALGTLGAPVTQSASPDSARGRVTGQLNPTRSRQGTA
jgi:hypothetical protein